MKKYFIGFKSGTCIQITTSNDDFIKDVTLGIKTKPEIKEQIFISHMGNVVIAMSEVEFIIPKDNVLIIHNKGE